MKKILILFWQASTTFCLFVHGQAVNTISPQSQNPGYLNFHSNLGVQEIIQIGTPKNIYRAPGNRFVAEFVGRNNIISGMVKSIINKVINIEGELGLFTVHLGGGQIPNINQEVSFVIAADLVKLSQVKPTSPNVIECSLISEEFIGSVVTLFLEAPNGIEIKVQIQERELSDMNLRHMGRVFASWATERAHFIGSE